MPGRTPLTAEVATPPWGVRLVRAINDMMNNPGPPLRPLTLFDVADAAALPPAAKHRFGAVYVVDIDRIAVSNGVDWLRQDTGAAL